MEKIEENAEEGGDVSEFNELRKKWEILREAAGVLRVEDRDLLRVIERFLGEISEMRKKLNLGQND